MSRGSQAFKALGLLRLRVFFLVLELSVIQGLDVF